MIRSAAERGDYLRLLADRVAQTHVLAIDAATICECCEERTSRPAAPSRVRCTGCGLLRPDMTVGQLGRQHHERRAVTRWPYRLRAGRMAACCLSAGRLGGNVESEVQGLHTGTLPLHFGYRPATRTETGSGCSRA